MTLTTIVTAVVLQQRDLLAIFNVTFKLSRYMGALCNVHVATQNDK